MAGLGDPWAFPSTSFGAGDKPELQWEQGIEEHTGPAWAHITTLTRVTDVDTPSPLRPSSLLSLSSAQDTVSTENLVSFDTPTLPCHLSEWHKAHKRLEKLRSDSGQGSTRLLILTDLRFGAGYLTSVSQFLHVYSKEPNRILVRNRHMIVYIYYALIDKQYPVYIGTYNGS